MAQFEYIGNKLSSGIDEYSVGKNHFKRWIFQFYFFDGGIAGRNFCEFLF